MSQFQALVHRDIAKVVMPITPPTSSGNSPYSAHHEESVGLKEHAKAEKRKVKGHSKSRRGCFDCKRRKIKVNDFHPEIGSITDRLQCQETRPGCLNCARLGLKCRYGPEITVPSPATTITLHEHRAFSLTDMRLYHHFLNAAYPHFPVRTENVWLAYILPIGHQVNTSCCSVNQFD